MDRTFEKHILHTIMNMNDTINISVSGNSMKPLLKTGDIITIQKCDYYEIGDVLVFVCVPDDLLVHRLLKKQGLKFICKGDNSFRIEEIYANQILGKVTMLNGAKLTPWPEWKIELSYQVHLEYQKNNNDKVVTRNTPLYKQYYETVLNE